MPQLQVQEFESHYMLMDLRFRELYDVKPGLDNLYLPIKFTRLFIRYTTRFLGYSISCRIFQIIVRLLNRLDSLLDVAYVTYLFKINIYKIEHREAMYKSGLPSSVNKKNEWAEYTIMRSKSMQARLNAKVYLSLLSRHGFYKNATPYNKPIINPKLFSKSSNKKIYIYGPNANNPPNPKYKDYVLVVLKPIDYNLTDFREKLLFVNGAHYLTKMVNDSEFCSQLIDIYGKVIVSSLSKIDKPFEQAKFPMFGNIAAPMALGRVIYNLLYRYGSFTCVIEGFDFYLDNDMYASYYPSLTGPKGEASEQMICDSLAVHDALFNFLYVKELCEYLTVHDSNEFNKLYTKSGNWYLSKLEGIRNFKLLKNL